MDAIIGSFCIILTCLFVLFFILPTFLEAVFGFIRFVMESEGETKQRIWNVTCGIIACSVLVLITVIAYVIKMYEQ